MKGKALLKSKKVKNILYTMIEILVVAGLIFGVMMYVYQKINNESDSGSISKVVDEKTATQQKQEKKKKTDYLIEANCSKNAVIVYEYKDKKHKKKEPIKVFRCSIGKKLKKGKYKTTPDYTWIQSEKAWHQYNTRIGKRCWIQSLNYSDKYSYTMNQKSYKQIGKKHSGKSILMYSGDAAWIFENCKKDTEVKVVKGKKSDQLPLDIQEKVKVEKSCGWDPTDPSKDNPYSKVKLGTVVGGKKTVYVEKGKKVPYISNILALNQSGKSIVKKLKYKAFDSNKLGKHSVKFHYKNDKGEKKTFVQEFRIVDTICPKVQCSNGQFTLYVESRSNLDLNNVKNLKKVENMVRPYVTCNEEDCEIKINTVNAGELSIKKFPIIITAIDQSGNVGSCQVMLDVKLREKKSNKSSGFTKKEKESLLKRAKEGEQGKLEEETKKEVKKKKKEKETKNEEEQITTSAEMEAE